MLGSLLFGLALVGMFITQDAITNECIREPNLRLALKSVSPPNRLRSGCSTAAVQVNRVLHVVVVVDVDCSWDVLNRMHGFSLFLCYTTDSIVMEINNVEELNWRIHELN